MPIAVIAGLGNPGPEYADTRHNLGFRIVEAVGQSCGAVWKSEKRFLGDAAKVTFAEHTVWLLKPMTYMNDSGSSLGALSRFLKIPAESFLVAYDEVQVPVGQVKISLTGSAGGHNGIKSLLSHLGDGFVRFRAGVGPKPAGQVLTHFVLDRFLPAERPLVEAQLPKWTEAIAQIVREGPEPVMNQLNRRDPNLHESCGNSA